MPVPKLATPRGLRPHYKVRIVLPGALLHLASWDVPQIDPTTRAVTADWIADPAYGDTLGVIAWASVLAITWRFAE